METAKAQKNSGWDGGKHDKKKNKDASELGELFSQKYSDPVLITPNIQRSALM